MRPNTLLNTVELILFWYDNFPGSKQYVVWRNERKMAVWRYKERISGGVVVSQSLVNPHAVRDIEWSIWRAFGIYPSWKMTIFLKITKETTLHLNHL